MAGHQGRCYGCHQPEAQRLHLRQRPAEEGEGKLQGIKEWTTGHSLKNTSFPVPIIQGKYLSLQHIKD